MEKFLQRLFPALSLAFFGVVIAQLGYGTLKMGHTEYIPENGPSRILSPASDAVAFWALSWGTCILGLFLLVTGAFVFIYFDWIASLIERVRTAKPTIARLKYLWRTVNSALILSVGWTGYWAMAPERVADSTPGLPWPSYFFIPPAIALMIIVFLHFDTRKITSFQRPSLDRPPFKWLSDSFQTLFIATLAWTAAAVGATIRLPGSGHVGYRFVVFAWCIPAGFIVGEIVGYAIYRRKITTI